LKEALLIRVVSVALRIAILGALGL
jgi:hypothetical protein